LTKPIPWVYTTRFFQLVTTRQFAEAERILERVKQKMHVTERNRGYFQALFGMLLAQRNNNDRYAFLSGVDLTDKKQLKKYRLEFLGHSESRLHAEYDRGFFEAWADYMKILPKLEASLPPQNNKGTAEIEKQKELDETLVDVEVPQETTVPTSVEEKENPEVKNETVPTKESVVVESVKSGQRTISDFAE